MKIQNKSCSKYTTMDMFANFRKFQFKLFRKKVFHLVFERNEIFFLHIKWDFDIFGRKSRKNIFVGSEKLG